MDSTPDRPVALVTGGSRGIGKAIAARLIGDGCTTIVTGRDPARLGAAAAEIGAAEHHVADVLDAAAVVGVVDGIVDRFGRLDVLVNNAGIGGFGEPLATGALDDWWQVVDVNLRGPAIAIRAALAHMIERTTGLIVNIGSYTALNRTPGASAYGASKAALAHLSASVADEVADTGVTVLCVSPGLVETDMTRGQARFDGIPADAWTPIEAVCELVSDLVAHDAGALSGRFLHARDDISAIRANVERIAADDLYRLVMLGLDGRLGR